MIFAELERMEDLKKEITRCKKEVRYIRTEKELKRREAWIEKLESILRKEVKNMISKREKLLSVLAEEPEKVFSSQELRELLGFNDKLYEHYNSIYKVMKSKEIDRVDFGKYRINAAGLATLKSLKKAELVVPKK